MLLELRISNFAVIDELEVSFTGGLTVLTGETGAGKSILIDALSLLLGGRADSEIIRAGEEEAVVEGSFDSDAELSARLESLGLPVDDELLIRRVIGRSGRTKAFVNGSMVNLGVLQRLMKGLVDIAGQHEHVALFDEAQHRSLVDREAKLCDELAAYRAHYDDLLRIRARMGELGGDEHRNAQRAEFLRFQLDELDRLAAKAGEDEALEQERKRLAGTDKLRRLAVECEQLLNGQDAAALELLHRAVQLLADSQAVDAATEPMLGTLRAAVGEVEGVSRSLARYAQSIDADPARLLEVEERLDAIKKICRKHGRPLDGVLALRAELSNDLASLESRRDELLLLSERQAEVEKKARAAAAVLSSARKTAGQRLSASVRAGLARLAMPAARFEVHVEPQPDLSAFGADNVRLFFSANAGEEPRPLAKVASGGEASRVLLAVKRALAATDRCGAYVLDEADSGVSGAIAEVVGRMIKDVAEHRQVLCITHLPQVAAYADAHLLIKKEQTRGRTFSRVQSLAKGQERTTELARMLSGVELTREAMGAAEALVRSAARVAASGRRVKETVALSSRTARVKPEKRRAGR